MRLPLRWASRASGLHFVRISTWDPEFVRAIRDHYTGSRGPPYGKKLAWCIEEDGDPIGWIGLGEPMFKLSPRRRLGLDDARPLDRTVCNFIFRRTGGARKGSEILRAWHPIAAREWDNRYGWAPVHWETLVLPSAVASTVPGACFRRAGYRSIGMTTGRSARRPPGSTHGPRVWGDSAPKLALYRGPLKRLPKDYKNPTAVSTLA